MAFDYGSIGLGIKNPFRLEGVVIATRGALQTLLSIYLLVSVSSLIDQSFKLGWITAVIGFILLSNGLYALGRESSRSCASTWDVPFPPRWPRTCPVPKSRTPKSMSTTATSSWKKC